MTFVTRPERPEDIPYIARINREAFGGPKTAQLIEDLRADGALSISLVAVRGDDIVGHVSFSPATITNGDSKIDIIGLAPLAVLPDCQRQGVGSALVQEGLKAARAAGWSIVIVLGNPDYYGRFGFESASKHGISWERKDAGPAFQVMELNPGALKGGTGVAAYHRAFENV